MMIRLKPILQSYTQEEFRITLPGNFFDMLILIASTLSLQIFFIKIKLCA